MRRKIPGRKHRGVRDPEKQNALRLEKLKNKINNPPANIDEQQVPKSLERLRILCDKVKNGEFARRKRTKKKPKMYQKLPHENEQQYTNRVKNLCDMMNKEAEFEKKFGVQIERDENGDVVDVKNPAKLLKDEKKSKNSSRDGNEKLTKSQKRQLKLREKKQRKELEERSDVEIQLKFIDTIRFGEQVHAPPVLTVPRKAQKNQNDNDTTRKPGQKNLLLKTMLVKSDDGNKVKTPNKIDRKGKRKDLPNSLRRQLEKQQKEVIEAYKAMKLKKKEST